VAVLVALLASLLVELVVAVWVAQAFGFGWMVLALVGLTALGLFLLPRVGLQGIRRVQQAVAAGEQPGRSMVDGGLLLVAAVLLIIPGFVTGVMGLALLVPPVRHAVAAFWSRRLGLRVQVLKASYGGSVIDTSATDAPPPARPELDAP
jgi:UPF0716 protein FxsA